MWLVPWVEPSRSVISQVLGTRSKSNMMRNMATPSHQDVGGMGDPIPPATHAPPAIIQHLGLGKGNRKKYITGPRGVMGLGVGANVSKH